MFVLWIVRFDETRDAWHDHRINVLFLASIHHPISGFYIHRYITVGKKEQPKRFT